LSRKCVYFGLNWGKKFYDFNYQTKIFKDKDS